MKILFAFLFTIAGATRFMGYAETDTFMDIIAYIKINAPMGAGKITWPACMILLASGIIGIRGIRRRGKRF